MTGANFLFEVGATKALIDCGMVQGVEGATAVNAERFPYDPREIDMLFITHAHVDHIGRVHKLVQAGFKGAIYSTPETKEIAELMLRDLIHIADENGQIVETVMKLWQTLEYHVPKDFGPYTVELFNAGHILGSAMYKFSFPSGRSIMFTGDLGNSSMPLLPKTDEVPGLTHLLMDSVYGDRNHESAEERDRKFKEVIRESVGQGGTLLIPVFSLERTQVILYELNKFLEAGEIPAVPVFLDSPLAIKLTHIYERVYGKEHFNFPKLSMTDDAPESMAIDKMSGPKIILAGSGMSTAGRIIFHEERFLPDPKTTILFVGYQAPGTLGRQIEEGLKEVEINGTSVRVNATIVSINGFSAHKDSDHLVEFVSGISKSLERVFVTMGEPKSSIFLAQRLHDELGVDALIPERGKGYELEL